MEYMDKDEFEKSSLVTQLINKAKSILRFPMTQCMVTLFTLIIAFVVVRDYTYGDSGRIKDLTGTCLTFLFVLGMGCFVTESVFDWISHRKQRILGYLLSLIPAILFAAAAYSSEHAPSEADGFLRLTVIWFPRFLTCFGIITFTLGIFFCFSQSAISFEKYMARTFASIVKHSILYSVLMIGVTLVLGILIALFPIKSEWDLFATTYCLLFGCYYVCALFDSFAPSDKSEGVFTEFLVKYVLTGLVACAFVIIYLYILKILITQDMPSNQIFGILSGLFLVGAPIWTMANSYREKNPLRRISRCFPYLFAPFILLQCYSVGIRILENGLTPSRYLGVILILFEIAYLMFYRFCRCKIPYLMYMICGFAVTACILPGINMYTASFMTQKLALEAYLKEVSEDISDKSFQRAKGAYDYLRWETPEGEVYLDQLKQEETVREKLTSFSESWSAPDPSTVCRLVSTQGEVDHFSVEGYSLCQKIAYHSEYYHDSEYKPIDNLSSASACTFTADDTDTQFTLNMGQLCLPYITLLDNFTGDSEYERNEAANEYFLAHNVLDLENGDRLILTQLSLYDYNREEDSLGAMALEGYLLKRQAD